MNKLFIISILAFSLTCFGSGSIKISNRFKSEELVKLDISSKSRFLRRKYFERRLLKIQPGNKFDIDTKYRNFVVTVTYGQKESVTVTNPGRHQSQAIILK